MIRLNLVDLEGTSRNLEKCLSAIQANENNPTMSLGGKRSRGV